MDDHRGGPPRRVTPDQASTPQEVLAALAVRDAITTVPRSSAALLVSFATSIAAVPLADAAPVTFVIAGPRDRPNPLVARFVAFVREALDSNADPIVRQRRRITGPPGVPAATPD